MLFAWSLFLIWVLACFSGVLCVCVERRGSKGGGVTLRRRIREKGKAREGMRMGSRNREGLRWDRGKNRERGWRRGVVSYKA